MARGLAALGAAAVRRTKHAGRTDANHTAVKTALGGMGCSVQSLGMVGDGCPDLLVGYRGQTFLVEVKDGAKSPSERKLTAAQERWHRWWTGATVIVAKSPDEAIEAVCGVRSDGTRVDACDAWRIAMGDV